MIRMLLIALTLAACGTPRPDGPPPEYPGRLVSTEALESPPALGPGFALEQRIRSESPAQDAREFRAVLQLDGGVLTLVGLGPHGGRAFVLTQRGDDVSFESNLPEELPFPPDFMLHDVQRAWFRGLAGPLPDGEHEGEVAGEAVTEQWQDGRLQSRSIRRDDHPDDVFTVTYEGGLGPEGPPERVVIDNGWFGYRLIVTTLSFERFTSEEAAPVSDTSLPGTESPQ